MKYKIYCSKDTDMVEQIFDYENFKDCWDQYNNNTFQFHYLVEVELEVEIDYSYKYNKEFDIFEKVEEFVQEESIIEKDLQQIEIDRLKAELEITQNALNDMLMNMMAVKGGD